VSRPKVGVAELWIRETSANYSHSLFYILPYNCLALSVAVWAYGFQSRKLRIVVLAEHI